jgi:hypothetical protein
MASRFYATRSSTSDALRLGSCKRVPAPDDAVKGRCLGVVSRREVQVHGLGDGCRAFRAQASGRRWIQWRRALPGARAAASHRAERSSFRGRRRRSRGPRESARSGFHHLERHRRRADRLLRSGSFATPGWSTFSRAGRCPRTPSPSTKSVNRLFLGPNLTLRWRRRVARIPKLPRIARRRRRARPIAAK